MVTLEQCPNCGNPDSGLLISGHDRFHGIEGNYYLQECSICGLIYLNPRPSLDEIERYYPEDYIAYPKAIEDEPYWFRRLDRKYGLHKRIKHVTRRINKPGNILDIGCATGIFLHGMQLQGWNTFGIEPSKYAADYARQRFGLSVVRGFLEDTHFPDNFFNLVSMWDVLEHVPEPLVTLTEVNRILAPGGWIVLSLPNPVSWDCNWFGPYWAGWDLPRHMQIFKPKVISSILKKEGFFHPEIISFMDRHGMLVYSIRFWLSDKAFSPFTKKFILDLAGSIPARILTYPYYALADCFNKSPTMIIFAQKK